MRRSLRGKIITLPVHAIIKTASFIRANRMFNRFRHEFIHISPEHQYTTMKDFEGYKSDADAFCSGSDQVWNSQLNDGIHPHFYLAFAPEGSYKFAFSSSFGRDTVPDDEVNETRKYINDYRHISVREDSGVKILNEQYNYNKAVHVLDPTLCIDPETWRKYAKCTMGGGGKDR